MKNPIKLSNTEIDFLLDLIGVNEGEGSYYGNPKQYWKRSERVKKILAQAIQYKTGSKK